MIMRSLYGWLVHFLLIMLVNASYASLFAMKIKKLLVNDRITALCLPSYKQQR